MENIKYKKKFGQNFLYDVDILNNIISQIEATENDLIIEIGPGSGNLTKKLKTLNASLYAFEIDTTLKNKLDILVDNKTKIIYQDILDVNLKDYIDNKYDNVYVVANIPYYITSPIIKKLIESNIIFKKIILMVQEEVADRLAAKINSKAYGYMSVYVNSFYKVKKLFSVKRECFFPVPNVDSAIIELIPVDYKINKLEQYNMVIESAFKYKRKTLKNNLKGYDLNKIESVLIKYDLSLNSRAEQVPIDAFIDISNII